MLAARLGDWKQVDECLPQLGPQGHDSTRLTFASALAYGGQFEEAARMLSGIRTEAIRMVGLGHLRLHCSLPSQLEQDVLELLDNDSGGVNSAAVWSQAIMPSIFAESKRMTLQSVTARALPLTTTATRSA